MNKAKKVKVDENENMIRNCKYMNGTEIDPYIYDGKLIIKGIGWQNSGVYFILDGEDGKQYYMSDVEFKNYIKSKELVIDGKFEFLKQGVIQSIGLVTE